MESIHQPTMSLLRQLLFIKPTIEIRTPISLWIDDVLKVEYRFPDRFID
jgi:hypothetical protein